LNSRLILSGVLGEVPISLFCCPPVCVCVWVFHSFPWATHTDTKVSGRQKEKPPKITFLFCFVLRDEEKVSIDRKRW
jgi:hypothetical protein